jgi:chitin disaccharide deacetylase
MDVHDSSAAPERRTLVVNGDDFGLTPGVNRGIVHAHQHGILTHASLITTAPFAGQALELAHETPSLSLGVHLLLVDGTARVGPGHVRTLVDDHARLRPTVGAFLRDWSCGRIDMMEVECELRAQIECMLATGAKPTHLDSHKHLHMWPPIFGLVTRLAREYGVPRVRLAVEHPALRLAGEYHDNPAVFGQAVANLMMLPLAWPDRRMAAGAGLESPSFVGRVHTGLLTEAALATIVRRLPPGTTELMTHPGFVDEHLERLRTRLRSEREQELAVLCAPGVRRALADSGVALAGARTLERADERAADEEVRGHEVCCES